MVRKDFRRTLMMGLCLVVMVFLISIGTVSAAGPTADFTGNVTTGTVPLTVQFTDDSTGGPDGWAWYFGDETYEGEWTCVNASAWSKRYAHSSAVMPDGSIVLMGGCVQSLANNETWRSDDYGATWECVNESSGWISRLRHSSVVMPNGSIIIMGGSGSGGTLKDIWRSDDYGGNWTCVNESAELTKRAAHTSVVMPDGSIIIMGGGGYGYNDTWRSENGGETWTCVNASSGWPARYYHTGVAMPDGSIVIMGGTYWDDNTHHFLNDVWQSDDYGGNWAQLPDAEWSKRSGHSSVVMPDGSIIIMGGWDKYHNSFKETWRSTDGGKTWTQLPDVGWTGRNYHTSVVMPDGSIIIMGGSGSGGTLNDVWRLETAGSTAENPTHTYTEPGTYTVTLQAYNDDGHNVTQKVAYITVTPPPPEAGFTANVTSGPAPLTVKFTDESTGDPTTWKWDFGDGETSTEENPTHTYTVPGTYTVTLTVENEEGSNTHTDSITVTLPPPEARFTASVTSGTAPLTVQFTDQSTNNPDGWTWYFGDETYEGEWTEQIDAAGWSARKSPVAVTMPNGNIILMGGRSADGKYLNDTWRSTDGGGNWTEMAGSAEWLARFGHTGVVMPDGSIVLMGGYGHGYGKDVWRSTDEGATWTRLPDAEWRARWDHTSVVMPNGNIILMGGSRGDTPRQANDVWRSDDYGGNWTRVTEHAEWPARYGQAAVVMPDGSIILMGGNDDDYAYKNDIWRSTDEGATWTQVAEHAEWSARYRYTSVAMPDGSIVIMGGGGYNSYMNDVWRSTDEGATWTQVAEHAEWSARREHTSVVMPDGSIILMGGMGSSPTYPNDVWRLETAGSYEQNPTHTYTVPGTYTVTLQAYNADGYNAMRKVGYITVTAPTPTPTSPPSSGGGGGSTVGPGGGYNVGGDSAVNTVTVTGTGLETLIVTGRVQSSPGAGIPPAPGTPYQYIELTPARFEEITGANITFSIPAAWLAEQGFAPGGIVMHRYNGTAWEALPTWVVDESGSTVTFTATSPGFSLFAISGIGDEGAVTTPTAVETTPPATTQPTGTETTAVPVGDAAPDFPLQTVALVAGGILVLAGAGYLVRRWWIRRQNPALIRDYD